MPQCAMIALLLIATTWITAPHIALAGPANPNTPNIILILADDIPINGTPVQMVEGHGNSHTKITNGVAVKMPTLETLAKEGFVFSKTYATSPICGPSRANLQLGTTPLRSGYTVNSGNGRVHNPNGYTGKIVKEPKSRKTVDLPKNFKTIAEKLKVGKQYLTAHFGKWHIWGGGPGARGYDYFWPDETPEHSSKSSNDWGKCEEGNPKNFTCNDPKRIGTLTANALWFINESAHRKKPFFLQLSHYMGHSPHEATPASYKKYQGTEDDSGDQKKNPDNNNAAYWGGMEDLDNSIGALLSKLQDHEIHNNTYIIFTTDNGYSDSRLYNQYLRGGKWWLFENGIRVPMIIWGPNAKSKKNEEEQEEQEEYTYITDIVSHHDLHPTILDWAGITADKKIDGISIAGLMDGENKNSLEKTLRDRHLYHYYPSYRGTKNTELSTPQAAIISGTGKKLLWFYDYTIGLEGVSNKVQSKGSFLFNVKSEPKEERTIDDLGLAEKLREKFKVYANENASKENGKPDLPSANDVDNPDEESDVCVDEQNHIIGQDVQTCRAAFAAE